MFFLPQGQPDSGDVLSGGHVVAFELANHEIIYLVSDEVSSQYIDLLAQAPQASVYRVPAGWLFYGDDGMRNEGPEGYHMAHIDTVINALPRQASSDGVPVLLVDSHYLPRLRAAWGERQKKLEAEGKIRIVTVDETKRSLNPTNFVVTPNHHVLM